MFTSNPQFVAVLNALKDGVIIIRPDRGVEFMSRALVRLFGPVQGRNCYQIIHQRESICPWCKAGMVFKDGKPAQRELYLPHLKRLFEVNDFPFEDAQGHISKLTIYRDITRDREREKKLKVSQQDYRSLFEHVACGVFISSKEGKFIDANQALVSMLGYDNKEDFLKIDITKDLYLKPEERQRFQELIERDGHVVDHEVYFKRKSGRPIPVLLTGHVRLDEQGNVFGYEGLNVDQSQRKQMEKELEKTRLQLVQSEKMASLGQLAAGVAHQLNNPLGGIMLFGRLVLEEYDLPDDCKKDIERILGDARRCSDIVKQLLQFSRQTKNEIQPHDINQALMRTLFLLENQTLFQNITVEKDLDENLPQVRVDILKINQVFMNIILNAAQAMEGNGTLFLKTDCNTGKKTVHIRIGDTGPGMDDSVLPFVFEPFFTTKKEGEGTGLGLSMAYGIVEDHGGCLTVKSVPGRGATFDIELPLGDASNDQ